MLGFDTGDSQTPITPVMAGEEATAQELSKGLWDEGVFAPAIVYPTVPRGGLGCGRSSRPITAARPRRLSMRSAGSATGSGCSRFAVRSGGSGGMTIDAERLEARARLGSVGVWSFALDELPAGGERRRRWPRSRHLGYPSLWIPGGAVQQGDHRSREPVARRERAAHHRDRDREHGLVTPSPSRTPPDFSPTIIPGGSCWASARAFLLTEVRGSRYERPWSGMRAYPMRWTTLPRVDRAGAPGAASPGRPWAEDAGARGGANRRGAYLLRAGGVHRRRPALARCRTSSSRSSRPSCWSLAPSAARHLARGFAADYLELPNYANNLAGSALPMRTSPGAGATG